MVKDHNAEVEQEQGEEGVRVLGKRSTNPYQPDIKPEWSYPWQEEDTHSRVA